MIFESFNCLEMMIRKTDSETLNKMLATDWLTDCLLLACLLKWQMRDERPTRHVRLSLLCCRCDSLERICRLTIARSFARCWLARLLALGSLLFAQRLDRDQKTHCCPTVILILYLLTQEERKINNERHTHFRRRQDIDSTDHWH